MPIYEYEHTEDRGPQCEPVIEVIQGVNDEPLEACPECGMEIKRMISRAGFIMGTNLSPDATAKQGFTTYRKTGLGTYEKAAGEGPDTLSAE